MTPFEQYLYNTLIRSPAFNRFVHRIYNRVNRIPNHPLNTPRKTIDLHSYKPTRLHKARAFYTLWRGEMKDSFRIW